jgi:hypothetical protein
MDESKAQELIKRIARSVRRSDEEPNPLWVKILFFVIAALATYSAFTEAILPLVQAGGVNFFLCMLAVVFLALTLVIVVQALPHGDFFKVLFILAVGFSLISLTYLIAPASNPTGPEYILAFVYPAIIGGVAFGLADRSGPRK